MAIPERAGEKQPSNSNDTQYRSNMTWPVSCPRLVSQARDSPAKFNLLCYVGGNNGCLKNMLIISIKQLYSIFTEGHAYEEETHGTVSRIKSEISDTRQI